MNKLKEISIKKSENVLMIEPAETNEEKLANPNEIDTQLNQVFLFLPNYFLLEIFKIN